MTSTSTNTADVSNATGKDAKQLEQKAKDVTAAADKSKTAADNSQPVKAAGGKKTICSFCLEDVQGTDAGVEPIGEFMACVGSMGMPGCWDIFAPLAESMKIKRTPLTMRFLILELGKTNPDHPLMSFFTINHLVLPSLQSS